MAALHAIVFLEYAKGSAVRLSSPIAALLIPLAGESNDI